MSVINLKQPTPIILINMFKALQRHDETEAQSCLKQVSQSDPPITQKIFFAVLAIAEKGGANTETDNFGEVTFRNPATIPQQLHGLRKKAVWQVLTQEFPESRGRKILIMEETKKLLELQQKETALLGTASCISSNTAPPATKSSTSQAVASSKSSPKAIFMMGPPGSGKTSIRNEISRKYPGKYEIIDSDLEKEKISKYHALVAQGNQNAASLVHQEANKRRTKLLLKTQTARKNYIYDGTGRNLIWNKELIEKALRDGYRVKLIYVSANLDTCIQRCANRALETGRSVPHNLIITSHPIIEKNWLILRQQVNSYKHYENSNLTPKCIESHKASM